MDNKYHYISVNKDYVHADSFNLSTYNRAFRYGDGFFETMHANGMEVQFFNDHYNRIETALSALSLELPDYFSPDFLKKQIAGLLSRCKLFQAVRVKLTVFRSGKGLYFPENNTADFIIEALYLGKGPYELNKEGITIGVFKEYPKPNVKYLQFKSLNAQLYILAAVYAKKNALDDVLLINDQGFVVEATSSNFFAVREKVVYTPSLNTGCVNGIMRKQIIKVCNELAYEVKEIEKLTEADLLTMDELFLTNAVTGVKHVSGFEKRRYYNKNARKIVAALNNLAF